MTKKSKYFVCDNAANDAIKWIEKNKKEIHKNGSGELTVTFETE